MKVKNAALLQYDEHEEGCIELFESFNSELGLLERLDILQDWIDVLRGHYKRTYSEYYNGMIELGGTMKRKMS